MITTDTTFPADNGRPMRAAYAAPSDSQKHPGVIVIHEIFGLNDDIRRITGMVADLGYAALAPDLYDRGGARLICIARTLMTLNRGEGDAFKDLDAARKFLQQQPGVDPARIGVIGFCMGGGFALMYAARAPLGSPRRSTVTCPRLPTSCAAYVPCSAATAATTAVRVAGTRLEKLLTEMGVDHDVKVYEEAGHSFMSRNSGFLPWIGKVGPMKAEYNPEAAEDSWNRIKTFFGRHLGH